MAKLRKKDQVARHSLEDEGEIITAPPIPPDGGWGWIVLVSSFTLSVLVDGVCLNIGVFFPHFLEYFQESKGKTSMAGSVLNGTYLIGGPIISALANRYGCRRVTIAGAIISSVAFFLATFSPNVDVLILLYGALAGFGFGLMYLPAIVMVGYYFEKRRAFATGVAVCGSGIGLFVFAPLSEHLLREYGWKGALWIVSAIVLHGAVFGSAYRPLKPTILKGTNHKGTETGSIYKKGSQHMPLNQKPLLIPKIIITPAKSDQLLVEEDRLDAIAELRKPSIAANRTVSEECLATASKTDSDDSNSKPDPLPGASWVGRLARSQDVAALTRSKQVEKETYRMAEKLFHPLYRKDIFYSGSIRHLPEFQSSRDVEDYERKVVQFPDADDMEDDENDKSFFKLSAGTKKIFKDMMDFSLLCSPTFVLYGSINTLVMFGFFVPFAYIPAQAMALGVDSRSAAFLVSILGLTNTVGRVLSGLVSDRQWADCVLINNVTLMLSGVITMLVPYLYNYGLLAAYSTLHGLAVSPYVSLRSVILVELLGLEKLTNAFGLIILFQGISSYLGSPIAGVIADSTGNYHAAFYMAGISLLVSGLIGLPLRRISKWENARKAAKSMAAEVGDPEEQTTMIT